MKPFDISRIDEVLPKLLARTDLYNPDDLKRINARRLRCALSDYFTAKVKNCGEGGLYLTNAEAKLLIVSQNDSFEYADLSYEFHKLHSKHRKYLISLTNQPKGILRKQKYLNALKDAGFPTLREVLESKRLQMRNLRNSIREQIREKSERIIDPNGKTFTFKWKSLRDYEAKLRTILSEIYCLPSNPIDQNTDPRFKKALKGLLAVAKSEVDSFLTGKIYGVKGEFTYTITGDSYAERLDSLHSALADYFDISSKSDGIEACQAAIKRARFR